MPDKPAASLPAVNKRRLKKLLTQMIDIYSPSGKEGQIVNELEEILKKAGLPVVRQPVDTYRDNLIVIPEDTTPETLFIGHIDTVPPYDWEHYKTEIDGDDVWGLGSADMKGGCAAMIEAFIAMQESNNDIPAALALVVGEETTGDGTEALLKEYEFSWAVVGEPTDLIPCLGHYGYLELELYTEGRRVHASVAGPQDNAVRTMLQVLLRLTTYLEKEKPDVVYNIRDVNSSQAGFAVPYTCEAIVDLHLPPRYPIGELVVELEEMLTDAMPENPVKDMNVVFATIHAGYQFPDKGHIPDLLRSIYADKGLSWNPSQFRSDSDANLLWASGVKPIILGPGQLEKAHTSDESVPLSQVESVADIYLDLLQRLTED